jgi:hypothetical protein
MNMVVRAALADTIFVSLSLFSCIMALRYQSSFFTGFTIVLTCYTVYRFTKK